MIRALIVLALSSTLLACSDAGAQERPRSGGELVFLVPSEPPVAADGWESQPIRHILPARCA